MTLSVNNFSNNGNVCANCQPKKRDRALSFNVDKKLKPVKIDKSNDGKFSLSEALKNFGKGLISPITSMFSSPKNFLIGAGMILGSMALIAATGGAAAPIMIASGIAIGTIQAGKAVYDIVTAKNGDDYEKAFYNAGGATSTIGLSVLGAKSALKQAGVNTKGLGFLSSIKKCFTSSKNLSIDCFKVFKTGHYKTNLANAWKIITKPYKLIKNSKKLQAEGEKNFEAVFNTLKEAFPDDLRPKLKGRYKSSVSIYSKLSKNEQILDLYGFRLVIDDVKPKNIERIILSLKKIMDEGIKLTHIKNYRGKKYSYFSNAQIKKLKAVSGCKTTISQKPNGYITTHLKFQLKDGKIVELQIRGSEIDKVANWEHLIYDIREGKDISAGNNKIGIFLNKFINAVKKLKFEQYQKYMKYIKQKYGLAQAKEFGGRIPEEPRISKGMDLILEAPSLEALHNKVSKLSPGSITEPFDLSYQLAQIFGTESLMLERN